MTAMTLDRSCIDTAFLDTAFPSAVQVTRPRPTVRLTRRGRLVVVVAALLVAFAVGVFVTAAGSVATQRPGTPEPTKIVQVSSGDTLWDIASPLADDGDVRAVMEQIKQLNALDSADLQAGQRLVVPAG
jgi:Tfp pilus assembly protein FimV